MLKIAGFGDNVMDRFLDRGIDYPGGNCVNFSVFAHQRGASAAYLGAFGSDSPGDHIRGVLEEMGVDLSRSVVRTGESGYAEVEVIDGERHFRGGNLGGVTTAEPLVLGAADLDYLADFDLVHSSVYSNSESELVKLRSLRALVSYDLSSESEFRSADYLRRVAPFVDLALLSCSNLTQEATERDLALVVGSGVRFALGTRGTDGAILFDGTTFHRTPAVPIPDPSLVVDTMGCGDAFVAAFVVELMSAGWNRHAVAGSDAVSHALAQAADFAMRQCLVAGAFGYGRAHVPVVDEFGVS
ncbi:MAG TPA: PfkB family carbohydrate kinase [Microbacteriaceae bacterium]